jgi:hypothetical protein
MKNVLEFTALWIGSAALATAIVGTIAYFLTPILNKLFWGSSSAAEFAAQSASHTQRAR